MSVLHTSEKGSVEGVIREGDDMNVSPGASQMDKGAEDGLDMLVEQLRPIHPERLRGTAGCETWNVAFSPGGRFFAWSMGYGVVKVLSWPLSDDEEGVDGGDGHQTASNRTLNCGSTVWCLAFGPHKKTRPGAICQPTDDIDKDVQRLLLATGLENGPIKIWRVSTGEAVFHLDNPSTVARQLAFIPDGTPTLLSGSCGGALRIWDLPTGKPLHMLRCDGRWVVCCKVSPDCSMIASICLLDYSVDLWSLRSYTLMKTLAVNNRQAVTCDFSPDGALLAIGSSDLANPSSRVELWDPYTAELLTTLQDCCECKPYLNSIVFNRLCFSPDGKSLALVDDHRSMRQWILGQDTFVMETPRTEYHDELCCTFHPQGGIVATGTRGGYARFWRAKSTVPSLSHLCRTFLRYSFSTHQIQALPIPKILQEFLAYRDLPKTQKIYCMAHYRQPFKAHS